MLIKTKELIKENPFLSIAISAITGAFILFIGFASEDLYKLRIKRYLFPPKIIILFESASISTLKPLYYINGKNHYYEITSFKIKNIGDYKTKKEHKLKIQARGEIVGITPKGLESNFKIDTEDRTIAILNIEGLEPKEIIRGEIHSFSKLLIDRDEVQIGIDPIGNFELIGPNLF